MSLDTYKIKVSFDKKSGVQYDRPDVKVHKNTTLIAWVKADNSFIFVGMTPPTNPFGTTPTITADLITLAYPGKPGDRNKDWTYNVIVAPKTNAALVTTGIRPQNAGSPTIRNH